jgi:hypothetical protein
LLLMCRLWRQVVRLALSRCHVGSALPADYGEVSNFAWTARTCSLIAFGIGFG